MKKICCLLAVMWMLNSCGQRPTFKSFETLGYSFDTLYPKELVFPDSTVSRRKENSFLLSFNTPPDSAAFPTLLKSSGFQMATAQTGFNMSYLPAAVRHAEINQTKTEWWIQKQNNLSTADSDIQVLKKSFGSALAWIAPVYQKNGVDGNDGVFVAFPDVMIIKTAIIDNDLQAELDKLGIKEIKGRSLPEYSYFKLSNLQSYNVYPLRTYLAGLASFKGQQDALFFENMPFIKPKLTSPPPDDPYWPRQQNLLSLIGVPEAWSITAGNHTVTIAILDYGCNVDPSFQDLKFAPVGISLDDNSSPGLPYFMADDKDHGTAVACIAAAIRDNGIGIAGIAKNASVISLALVRSTDAEVASGITYAANHHADIINMSIGTYTWDRSILDRAIQYAYAKGVVLCAASGNGSKNNLMTMPAKHPLVMAIGGSDGDTHDPIADYGDIQYLGQQVGISVVAPSEGVISVDFNGLLWQKGGTSVACPQVAGVAALIKSNYPHLTNVQIREVIEASADTIGVDTYTIKPGYANRRRTAAMGYGRVNAHKALLRAGEIPIRADSSYLLHFTIGTQVEAGILLLVLVTIAVILVKRRFIKINF